MPCVAPVEENAATFRILQFYDGGIGIFSPAEDFPDFRDVNVFVFIAVSYYPLLLIFGFFPSFFRCSTFQLKQAVL